MLREIENERDRYLNKFREMEMKKNRCSEMEENIKQISPSQLKRT